MQYSNQTEEKHRSLINPLLTPQDNNLAYISPLVNNIEINSEYSFDNLTISLSNQRVFFGVKTNSIVFINFWNCVSIGQNSSGIFLVVSDVIMNEKISQN